MTEPPRLVLASGNAHKLAELRRALPDVRLELLGGDEEPVENGDDYEANARIKARFARSRIAQDAWALGEDSGIEAAALDGQPGVRTARWAAGDPVGRMLAALADVDDRRARYVSVLVAVGPGREELVARGEVGGTIARRAAGDEGFGFDPVFVPEGETRTVAELGDEWKRVESHRARAAAELDRMLAEARTVGGSGRTGPAPTTTG
ncbi:MAG: non-canonical purine NTP pyrophosphatase [Actinobacteria bacterium]|nr:non-canonical purine NTP pyrophosphatase [Actinomycetota bacterium]